MLIAPPEYGFRATLSRDPPAAKSEARAVLASRLPDPSAMDRRLGVRMGEPLPDGFEQTEGGPLQPTQDQKAADFRALHEGEAFVIPNPWDAGSARVLAALGFKALASTSSGFAFTLGRLDGDATLDEVVEHVAAIDRATELPVSVDLENGYGADPGSAALAIKRVAAAG